MQMKRCHSAEATPAISTADPYAQLAKNSVSSKGQLKAGENIRFLNPEGRGPRVLFVGNSITLHGPKAEIGWMGDWGMAASAEEKDYVHLLAARVWERYPDAAFCICQVADWERGYKKGSDLYDLYTPARDFGADVIVVRLIENCPQTEFDAALFEREYADLFSYLDGKGGAKIILTTGFWRHPGDEAIRRVAEAHALPLVLLGDLGEDDSMKAIGLFEHSGVAAHPGDGDMEAIAARIWQHLEPILP